MKAKDTVMIRSKHCNTLCHRDQAEISFKAGWHEGWLSALEENRQHIIDKARKEVVEWYEYGGSCFLHHAPLRRECPECKKAQLKEWDIKLSRGTSSAD